MTGDQKETIRSFARIEDVISRYLPLHRAGSSGKTLTGLCPFHADHHPSLQVNTRDQYYKCFACGEGGDVFKFVQEMEHCTFPEALNILAGWYGIETSGSVQTVVPRRVQPAPVEKPLPVRNEAAGRALLKELRGISKLLSPFVHANPLLQPVCSRFGVGMAPERMPAGFAFLCNRLVFPIRNERGDVVAFSGRYRGDAAKDGVAKYINSATSAVYHKGEIMYGLYESRPAIEQHHFVYITEGYKDVLAMHAAGFTNTVATCGTAFTDSQMALLGRYTRTVVLLFDGDQPGCQASDQVAVRLRDAGFTVSQIFLPPGHDPDSLLADYGAEAFDAYMRRATRYSRMEAYEYSLATRLRGLLANLALVLAPSECPAILKEVITVRRRLAKVTVRLGHGAVALDL